MISLEKVTHLSGPPVVGCSYLVPTIVYPWLLSSRTGPWPVFPNLHEDAELLGFKWDHYHIDPRFLDARTWEMADSYNLKTDALGVCQGFPLATVIGGKLRPHPPIVWRRRVCKRELGTYRFHYQENIGKIAKVYAGQQCERARTGWVCPHRNYPLGSIEPDINGVITCPLHGLKVRADDGVVLP
ncbi:Rieske 2Fe-2S domain-containing protein [Phenylobacterium sp.]|uniref:Rieske 2Fe-2S domain-containing protein n=1 Tax=Phenylobacterium sp. TaxID=1871053 RepID=UPI002FC8C0FF